MEQLQEIGRSGGQIVYMDMLNGGIVTRPEETLSAYDPSVTDRWRWGTADFLRDNLGFSTGGARDVSERIFGKPFIAPETDGLTGLLDSLGIAGVTGLSAVPEAVQAGENIGKGDYLGAAGSAGSALLDAAPLMSPLFKGAKALAPDVKGIMDFLADESGALRLTRQDAPLIGHHNLSSKGVQVASEIGGIPMPSMAISRADFPMTNFGDVTLLADPKMVSPSWNVTVWPTDVYTGRQPRGELQFANDKAATSAMKADPNFGHMRDITYWMDSTNSFSDADEMMKTAQLGLREGINPASYGSMWDYVRDVRSKLGYSAYEDTATMPGFEAYGGIERVLYPKDMFTASGNRRKPVPYTLGAVMDRMAKGKAYMAGTEGGMGSYGPGSFRAVVTPPFRSMADIDASRGLIWPSDQMADVKSAFSDAYGSILDDVNSAYTGSGWGEGDIAMREIAAGKNPTWFGNIPSETRSNVKELAKTARTMPTEYFEAKPRIAYRLDEFPAAIVPSGDAASADLLKSSGVKNILTYGSPDERAALFKRFPELMFSAGGLSLGGLLTMQPDQERY